MVSEIADDEDEEDENEEKKEDSAPPSLPPSSSSSFAKGLELYDIFFLSLVRRLLTKMDGKDKDR